MARLDKRPLTETDKERFFKIATASLSNRCAKEIGGGMTDDQLADALNATLGIFGGSGGPDRPSVSFTGSGLRIWGGWHVVNHVTEKPLFARKTTIAMARRIYDIADPNKKQMELF